MPTATKKTPARKTAPTGAPISDASVQKATGQPWAEWFRRLDARGAVHLEHRAIADILAGAFGLPGWWAQMITVGYERARGLRVLHETTTGFQISRSKTVAVPLARLYAAFATPKARAAWLDEPIEITKATKPKSLYAKAQDGATRLQVLFTAKGEAKSAVSVQENKIPDARNAERRKKTWAAALDRLATVLSR